MGEIKQSVVITGLKGEKRVNALLDSGAQTSFVKESIIKKIGILKGKYVSVETADGTKQRGRQSEFFINVKRKRSSVFAIIVKKLTDDLILGQDYLQKNDVILDFKNDKFSLGERQPKIRKVYRL